MPEQIELALELAQKHHLPNVKFLLMDTTDLSCFPDQSKDVVVIFGVLHHIPQWREVVQECYRVLRDGGKLFVEEPDGRVIAIGEKLFHWGHPGEALFDLPDFEQKLAATGFTLIQQWQGLALGFYAAQK
jgi:ubiquinone/menaquinone biosynthesis C-methylase UbiE